MKPLFSTVMRAAVVALLLIGSPLIGLIAAGLPVAPYLEFPPHSRFVDHAPFSWTAFVIIGLLALACAWP
ncbi:MAG: hypothetical protein JJV98_02355, partial [Desulfosarcina sp.]|nr:hypothetical protein [Desulfobacterales bacterium]